MWKRLTDVFGSLIGLIVLSPMILIISMIIKTVSPGPVFFKQERIGLSGKVFSLLKFRSMKVNNDTTKHRMYLKELINVDHDRMKKMEDDKNIIPFGKLLRATCLDELPQLINVLKGDMRLFGYRPEEPRTFYWMPKELQEIFLKHKPGIIDLASLHFIDEEELLNLSRDPNKTYWEMIKPMKIALQFFYFNNKSILMNLAIIWGFLKRIIKK